MLRDINAVFETLKNAKNRGTKCTVLIGAGCSVQAGIPTAKGFVARIEKDYPAAYARAQEKTYAKCMDQLSVGEQRGMIAEYVDKAKINWAHIALAQLMKSGYVDRILTTNFDLLIIRACALLGLFPASYDFASSQRFEPDKVPNEAVFYLHGQRTGFVLINTEDAFREHSEKLAPVFEDAGRGRIWLVVGYSGDNDPVFSHLSRVPRFDNNLYWVGHNESEPASHVRDHLLLEGKSAFYIKGFDADTFFVTLAQMLSCFPPDLVKKPFSYLDSLFESVTPYTFPKSSAPVDGLTHARIAVREAIKKVEGVHMDVLNAWSNLLGGNYNDVISMKSRYRNRLPRNLVEAVKWAHIMEGNALAAQARTKTGTEADRLFTLAGEKYQAALQIKPDLHEALYNWGSALLYQVRGTFGDASQRLFNQAKEILLRAETIQTGSGAYNLACVYALLRDEAECQKWLLISQRSNKLPNRAHLEQDSDLDPVRSTAWFREFIATL